MQVGEAHSGPQDADAHPQRNHIRTDCEPVFESVFDVIYPLLSRKAITRSSGVNSPVSESRPSLDSVQGKQVSQTESQNFMLSRIFIGGTHHAQDAPLRAHIEERVLKHNLRAEACARRRAERVQKKVFEDQETVQPNDSMEMEGELSDNMRGKENSDIILAVFDSDDESAAVNEQHLITGSVGPSFPASKAENDLWSQSKNVTTTSAGRKKYSTPSNTGSPLKQSRAVPGATEKPATSSSITTASSIPAPLVHEALRRPPHSVTGVLCEYADHFFVLYEGAAEDLLCILSETVAVFQHEHYKGLDDTYVLYYRDDVSSSAFSSWTSFDWSKWTGATSGGPLADAKPLHERIVETMSGLYALGNLLSAQTSKQQETIFRSNLVSTHEKHIPKPARLLGQGTGVTHECLSLSEFVELFAHRAFLDVTLQGEFVWPPEPPIDY